MAFLVSISFSFPPRSSKIESSLKLNGFSTPLKASLQKKVACSAVSKLSTIANKKSAALTVLNHAHHTCGYCQRQETLPLGRQFYGPVSCIFVVNHGTRTVLSGYWSGPDVEDGWGFVEAYVDQTT